jgi:hypothetical protein
LHYLLVGLNCRYTHSCPALFYLRQELLDRQPEAKITLRQLTINDPYYETLLAVTGNGADAIFFPAYIWNAAYLQRLVNDLATVLPGIPVVIGGPQAPFMKGLPENVTVVTGAVEGIGEDFYRDLARQSLAPAYMAESCPAFRSPYLDEDFAEELRNRHVYYESSRGCPFRCSYCMSAASREVRHNSMEQVIREIGEILAHEPRIIKFVDRTFNDDPNRALAIWKWLAVQQGHTRFHFEIAPDRFTSEMLDFLENIPPGRFQFEIGIQSVNARTLEAINRRMDLERAEANIRRLTGFNNLHIHVDLILGLPYETGESFRESFNRVFALEPHYIQMGLLKVLPGTPLRERQREFGLVLCAEPPYQVLANRWLSHSQLARLHAFGGCVETFYNHRYFRTLWHYIRSRGEEPFSFFLTLLAVRQRSTYHGLAPTRELLARILWEMAGEREDGETVRELLRYDWLRCGHRFLPEFLSVGPLGQLRSMLWHRLPQNMEGAYTHHDRRSFFKQADFLEMSGAALRETGLDAGGRKGIVCFLPQQTGGVFRHRRTMLVERI